MQGLCASLHVALNPGAQQTVHGRVAGRLHSQSVRTPRPLEKRDECASTLVPLRDQAGYPDLAPPN